MCGHVDESIQSQGGSHNPEGSSRKSNAAILERMRATGGPASRRRQFIADLNSKAEEGMQLDDGRMDAGRSGGGGAVTSPLFVIIAVVRSCPLRPPCPSPWRRPLGATLHPSLSCFR